MAQQHGLASRSSGGDPDEDVYIWHVLPSRRWPASPDEEKVFVRDLTSASKLSKGRILHHERGDTTTVLNALRCGMSFADLLCVAPGVSPSRLLSAYRYLESLRASSLGAFASLLSDLSESSVLKNYYAAAQLMPVPTFHLMAAARTSGLHQRARAAAHVQSQLESTARVCAEQEARLFDPTSPASGKVRLGRVLYDPYIGGLWSHPYFLPMRVGVLDPGRVRDLLGEGE